eukprot:Nitzschia sp. Nitz4//scaffold107_size73032//33551//34948//NITZ4_005760-RA/size73032-processed-gene-0.125-mRNA-1//-1//CDS//3329532593//2250//frame0
MTAARIQVHKQRSKHDGSCAPKSLGMLAVLLLLSFVIGGVMAATVLLHMAQLQTGPDTTSKLPPVVVSSSNAADSFTSNSNVEHSLHNQRILVAIAAYDFSQLPHLEEVIDGYQDLCTAGAAKVDVVIHATVPYPVTLIDLWNTRLLPGCRDTFSLEIKLVPSSLRLHLVDCHRPLFYDNIDNYDLFIYTEDDIRVTPRTVAAYLGETLRLRNLLGPERSSLLNVGIVRYEYNFPSNVVMDDKTRHATQNVTRVYWEHSMFPPVGKAVDRVPLDELKATHVHMKNHHQGMFLATRDLLLAWKEKKGCEFDKVRNRPGVKGRPSQPSEGTQRVWMSSQMLYGGRHCGIQQVIPMDSFGTLTVLHLPNKNYRRVGHFRNRTFSDGTEHFDFGATGALLTAMELHLAIRKAFPTQPQQPYWGIRMVDEVRGERSPLLERRMGEYERYVNRGGVLTEEDMTKKALVEVA